MDMRTPKHDDDDGRVICNMDVEGMRWHDRSIPRKEKLIRKAPQGDVMTKSEARQFTWYALLAAGLVVLVFSAVWVLFTLFCTQIWLR